MNTKTILALLGVGAIAGVGYLWWKSNHPGGTVGAFDRLSPVSLKALGMDRADAEWHKQLGYTFVPAGGGGYTPAVAVPFGSEPKHEAGVYHGAWIPRELVYDGVK